jgi:antitoxin StbD
MTRLLTTHIATMTELREPHKVLKRANGHPVAILKNSAVIGHLVPVAAVSQHDTRVATLEEVMDSLKRRRHINQPVLDYLKDK